MITTTCRNEYVRPGGRERGDRIVRCHLPAGHPSEHEEADTEITWTEGTNVAEYTPEPLDLSAWRELLRVADVVEYAAACRWAVPALLSELERTRAERDDAYGQGRDDEAAGLPMRVRFWVCPIREHRERNDDRGWPVVTVVWRGEVAHCTAPGCECTSAGSWCRD